MSEAHAKSSNVRTILGRWRKAVSITEDEQGGLFLHRYDKERGRWIQLLYFKSSDDFEDFLDWAEDLVFSEEPNEDEL